MAGAVDLITALVGSGGALTAVGGIGKFVWRKIEARFERIEGELEHCRQREVADRERRAVHLTAIELLWQEVQRIAPDSPVLRRAKKLLDELKTMAKEAQE